MKHLILIALLGAAASYAEFDLQSAIDDAKAGTTVVIPAGTYNQPVSIKKGITLKGDGAVLDVASNRPAILIDSSRLVTIEGITIKWKTKTPPQKGDTPYAVFVRAGEALIQDCSFVAPGSGDESTSAATAMDKSELHIRNCRFNGFEYTIQFWNGAEGTVENCIVMNPGHCGITIGHGSKAALKRNVVTGSRYHGIRCTGGEIEAERNLVVGNKNRGFYIGNRSATGELRNNLIVDNAIGINVFANSKLEIENNVITRSGTAGLSIIDTSKLDIDGNIIVNNEKGAVGFSAEKGQTTIVSIAGKNLVFDNTVEVENAKFPSKTLRVNPEFRDADMGLFETTTKEMGLDDPAALQQLWQRWQAALDAR